MAHISFLYYESIPISLPSLCMGGNYMRRGWIGNCHRRGGKRAEGQDSTGIRTAQISPLAQSCRVRSVRADSPGGIFSAQPGIVRCQCQRCRWDHPQRSVGQHAKNRVETESTEGSSAGSSPGGPGRAGCVKESHNWNDPFVLRAIAFHGLLRCQ